MTQPTIEITLTESGEISTLFRPFQGSTIHVGMMLASAARVIAASFQQELNLAPDEEPAILAQIVRIFNNDISIGDMGEVTTAQKLEKLEADRE